MKKTLLLLLPFLLFSTVRLWAQDKDSVTTLPTVTVTAGTKVNAEVDKAFKKTFPAAQDLKWYKLNKDYLAKFIESDMKHHALFSKGGRLKYDISYGYENNISEEMRKKIQGAYGEYDITRVANVKEAGRNIWVINLENPKHLVLVRVEDEDMEEVAKYDKTK
jgi:hypothetical protein